ncbi:MAG: fumarylacetoacetate hydrolase family protein [Phototrophicaceae bacterium]
MKLLTFITPNGNQLGIVTERGIIDVARASHLITTPLPPSAEAFYTAGLSCLPALQELLNTANGQDGEWLIDEATLTLAPIVPNPQKIICVGLNYRRHAEESGMAIPTTPVLFSKFNNALASHRQDIPMPALAERCDYEAELLAVIGRDVSAPVTVEDALQYVLGYSTANDLSARDLQMMSSQWLLGKTLDAFLPIGPYLVTSDDLPNPQNLVIKGIYNGEVRQHSNTADMIFSVAEVIAYISRYFTLKAGDIISTGTPEGVILGQKPPQQWMQAGDEFIVEIEGIGQLVNRMV